MGAASNRMGEASPSSSSSLRLTLGQHASQNFAALQHSKRVYLFFVDSASDRMGGSSPSSSSSSLKLTLGRLWPLCLAGIAHPFAASAQGHVSTCRLQGQAARSHKVCNLSAFCQDIPSTPGISTALCLLSKLPPPCRNTTDGTICL